MCGWTTRCAGAAGTLCGRSRLTVRPGPARTRQADGDSVVSYEHEAKKRRLMGEYLATGDGHISDDHISDDGGVVMATPVMTTPAMTTPALNVRVTAV